MILFDGVSDLVLKVGFAAEVRTEACGEGYLFAKLELQPIDLSEVVAWMVLSETEQYEQSVELLTATLAKAQFGATEVERQVREPWDPSGGPLHKVQAKLIGSQRAGSLPELVAFATGWFDQFAREVGELLRAPHRESALGCDIRLFMGPDGTPLPEYVDQILERRQQLETPTP
ncbi:hypothetical protein HY375_02870 [Candidatus Berkelbacteria bacterium]|nr:hypothetical protein [Candidatus Berkelbacteria bacterium]